MHTTDFEEFAADYCPMPNPFNDNADYHGLLLGMENPDYHRVMTFMQQAPEQVWTLVSNKDGSQTLHSGFTTIRAIGYVITSIEVGGVVEVID